MRILFILVVLFCGTSAFTQNEALAKNYFDQGSFDKALPIFEKLYQSNPGRRDYLLSLVSTYQQMENYSEAEKLLLIEVEKPRAFPNFLIELGRNYELQNKTELAEQNYGKALATIEEQPNFTTTVATTFEKYNLLDHAVKAYEKGMEVNPQFDYNPQLARIYGEQGNLEKMFTSFLNLVEKNPTFIVMAQRSFNAYVTDDPENEANDILRKTLLRRSQSNPDFLYNELLSWLFVQQKEYDKAFAQQRALFMRSGENLSALMDLAMIARENVDYETARKILEFVIANTPSEAAQIDARRELMQVNVLTAKKKEYTVIEKQYEEIISKFGTGPETIGLQIDYNHFLAFQQDKKETAIANLRSLSKEKLSRYQEARVLLELADILVFDEKFNEALIYYSQIQNKLKNDPLAQEARFKVARTSYFKGDFEWAQTQLDILKKSTSQLIANDAMELSLLMSDNSLEDSTHTALKLYAKADLLALQNKDETAIVLLDRILKEHKGESIEDEALYKQALVYEKTGAHQKAIANYLLILEFHNEDILADNTLFRLAELYNKTLQEPQKAKEYYEQIIFNHQDSIYFVEARKQFRSIRGDAIN